jgi:hypothetical protein
MQQLRNQNPKPENSEAYMRKAPCNCNFLHFD